MLAMYFSIAVFLAVILLFAFEIVHRTPAALIGAALVILVPVLGVLDAEKAIEFIRWETLGLLVGMMILVGILKDSGIFEYMAVWSAKRAGGRPGMSLISLGVVTGVLSAFLDNVTTILLIIPVTLVVTRILGADPVPFFITEVISSNIGGTATLIGDPPNIIIGTSVEELGFIDFIVNLTPVVIITLVVVLGIIYLVRGRKMEATEEQREELMSMKAGEQIKDRGLLIRGGGVMAATVLTFFAQPLTGFAPGVVALAGAGVAMLICSKQVESALQEVEWPTIMFFVGLFVLVGALRETGFISMIANLIGSLGNSLAFTSILVIWGSAIASGIVDNIPFTLAMVPVVKQLLATVHAGSGDTLWWALSLGACFGGNLTLVGASANVVAYGLARQEGIRGFNFWSFTAWGVPLTVVSLIISTVWILLVEVPGGIF